MKLAPLVGFFLLTILGIMAIKNKKIPYGFFGKIYFIEGNVAIVLGLVIIMVGILFYFMAVEDL
ncbi:MAG TPA: hypothetical protein VJ785_19410 [Anaerolineales bacterium]|nr:hypothetical protein [Anaerolineales bacterium]